MLEAGGIEENPSKSNQAGWWHDLPQSAMPTRGQQEDLALRERSTDRVVSTEQFTVAFLEMSPLNCLSAGGTTAVLRTGGTSPACSSAVAPALTPVPPYVSLASPCLVSLPRLR